MFKGLKLDNCNRDLVMPCYGSKLWFYNFDICNPILYLSMRPKNKVAYFLKLVTIKKIFA